MLLMTHGDMHESQHRANQPRELKLLSPLVSWTLAVAWVLSLPVTQADANVDRTVKPVLFAKKGAPTIIKGHIAGYHYVDYQLRAGAGQTLKVSMQVSNLANYFNVLPPGSTGAAMFIAGAAKLTFSGLLPADGTYTVRVYLMRSAARRNESGNYTLSIAISGQALPPVSARTDAKIPGTPYHAQATIPCAPAYAKTRECDARVIRRGFDGTATVELQWDNAMKRNILFVKGRPAAADTPAPFTFTRNERGYVIVFDGDERFDIPEPLVFGG